MDAEAGKSRLADAGFVEYSLCFAPFVSTADGGSACTCGQNAHRQKYNKIDTY